MVAKDSMHSFTQADFTISTDPKLLDIDMVYRYLSEQSYWAKGIDKSVVERSIQHSLSFGVYLVEAGEKVQVGFARVVTDYSTFAYLADVFVLFEYQGQGLGKRLVETVLRHPQLQSLRRWALYTKDAHDLYRRFGFEKEREPDRYMIYLPNRLPESPGGSAER